MNDGRDQPPGTAKVTSLRQSAARGWLHFGPWVFACALGPAGMRALKREGDGATPRGLLRLREVFYRADRVARPCTRLPVRAIRPADGWCDADGDRNYNRPVLLPYQASAEAMWRTDGLYDLLGVLGHNDLPRRQGRGSCIFLHIAHEDLAPTAGCIALARKDLIKLLSSPVPLRAIAVGR